MWQEESMRHLTPPMFPGLHISKISAFRKIYYYCFSDFHWPGIIDLQLKGRNKRPFHPQGTPASSSQGVASTQYPWSGAPGQWPPAAYQGCPQEPVIFLALLLPPPPRPRKTRSKQRNSNLRASPLRTSICWVSPKALSRSLWIKA